MLFPDTLLHERLRRAQISGELSTYSSCCRTADRADGKLSALSHARHLNYYGLTIWYTRTFSSDEEKTMGHVAGFAVHTMLNHCSSRFRAVVFGVCNGGATIM